MTSRGNKTAKSGMPTARRINQPKAPQLGRRTRFVHRGNR